MSLRRLLHISPRRRTENVVNVFNRSAKLSFGKNDFDFLNEDIRYRLSDRVLDLNRKEELRVDQTLGIESSAKHLVLNNSSINGVFRNKRGWYSTDKTPDKNLLDISSKCSLSLHSRMLHTSSRRRTENVMNVFDRSAKLAHREKVATLNDFDFLKEEIGYRLSDRVLDIKRKMKTCVDLSSGKGFVTRHLTNHSVSEIHAVEMSPNMLDQCQGPDEAEEIRFEKVLLDEDGAKLPFESRSVDLVTSSLGLHWVNDLPGLFNEVNRILVDDGVFIGCMFGGETLFELRCSLQMADLERLGGVGVHVSPFVEVQDLGNLLNRCGFTMLTIDSDELKAAYPSPLELMRDLKGMAENNATWERRLNLRKDVLLAASAIYKQLYANDDGTLPATFQVFYWIGWKPSKSQPRPLNPQKSDVSLKDLYKLEEVVKEKMELKDNNTNDDKK